MTKYILHEGNTSESNDDNSNFFEKELQELKAIF